MHVIQLLKASQNFFSSFQAHLHIKYIICCLSPFNFSFPRLLIFISSIFYLVFSPLLSNWYLQIRNENIKWVYSVEYCAITKSQDEKKKIIIYSRDQISNKFLIRLWIIVLSLETKWKNERLMENAWMWEIFQKSDVFKTPQAMRKRFPRTSSTFRPLCRI